MCLEIDGTGLVGGKDRCAAVVIHIEDDVGGPVGGEVLVEVLSVDGWDGVVLRVVEEVDGFVAARSPPFAEVVGLHCRYEAFGEVGFKIEHVGGEIVGQGMGIDECIDFLACVLFAKNPFIDVAQQRFDEYI